MYTEESPQGAVTFSAGVYLAETPSLSEFTRKHPPTTSLSLSSTQQDAEPLQFPLKLLSIVVLSTLQGWGHSSGWLQPWCGPADPSVCCWTGWRHEAWRWKVIEDAYVILEVAQAPVALMSTSLVVPRLDYLRLAQISLHFITGQIYPENSALSISYSRLLGFK